MIQFADSVGVIQVYSQVVRIDLLKAGPPARGQGVEGQPANTPALEPSGQLMLPIEGFLQMFGAMEQTLHKLAEAGVIQRNGPGPGGPGAGPGLPSAAGASLGMPPPMSTSASAGGKKKRS